MAPSLGRRWLPVSLLVLLLVGATLPSQAAYDKLYKFTNKTGASQTGVQATLDALESVTAWYTTAPANPFGAGRTSTGQSGMSFYSLLTWGGATVPASGTAATVTVGWTVSGHQCGLMDLEWRPSAKTIASYTASGTVNGGGFLTDNGDGTYTWWITDLQPAPLVLQNTEMATVAEPLTSDALEAVADAGIVGQAIEPRIAALRQAVVAAGAAGSIPTGWVTALSGKLDNALADMKAASAAYRLATPDWKRARFLWGRAAQHMQTFVSQIAKGSRAKQLAAWVTEAQQIIALLQALPGTTAAAGPLAAGGAVGGFAAGAAGAVVIEPGVPVAVFTGPIPPGGAVVFHGTQPDATTGEPLIEWVEQVSVPANGDVTPPEASATLDKKSQPEGGWDHCTAPVTVTLTATDTLGPDGPDNPAVTVLWDQRLEGDTDELQLSAGMGPETSLDLTQPGRYQIVYLAEDFPAGNRSVPKVLQVEVTEFTPVANSIWIGPRPSENSPNEGAGQRFTVREPGTSALSASVWLWVYDAPAFGVSPLTVGDTLTARITALDGTVKGTTTTDVPALNNWPADGDWLPFNFIFGRLTPLPAGDYVLQVYTTCGRYATVAGASAPYPDGKAYWTVDAPDGVWYADPHLDLTCRFVMAP